MSARSSFKCVHFFRHPLTPQDEVRDLDDIIEALNTDKDKASRDLKAAKKEHSPIQSRLTKLEKTIDQLEERVAAKEANEPWTFPRSKKFKSTVRRGPSSLR